MFDPSTIDLTTLKKRAYNHRWAAVPDDVIPLTAADPDFKVAPPIIEAIQQYTEAGYFNYGPTEGLQEFREAVAKHFSDHRSLQTDQSQVLAVDSAAYGIYLTCKAFLQAGDEAIIFDPVDFLFRYGIESSGAKAVPWSIDPTFDIAKLKSLINKKTRLICLCNPLNPTGKVFNRAELQAIATMANEENLIILSDEIWSDIVFQPNTFTSIASLGQDSRNNTITITGFSKSYGLAGFRIGAIIIYNQGHYDKIFAASQHDSTVHGINTIGQIAATAALNDAQPWLRGFLDHLHEMRDLTVNGLNILPGFQCLKPQGCYLAFPNIEETGMKPESLQQFLLEKAGVLIVPGIDKWFGNGARGHMRLSFATTKEIMEKALERIENALKKRLC